MHNIYFDHKAINYTLSLVVAIALTVFTDKYNDGLIDINSTQHSEALNPGQVAFACVSYVAHTSRMHLV